jgi:hypothetical protein
MKHVGIVSAAALLLAACGQAGPAGTDASPETAPKDTVAVASETPPAAAPKASTDSSGRLFGHKVYSPGEAFQTDLFGVKVGMSVDEVRQALADKGFTAPDDPHGLDLRITELGLDCSSESRLSCSPGLRQKEGYMWTRPVADDPGQLETLLPLFYVDENSQQKLYYVDYSRTYTTEVAPSNLLAAMVDRFGEPSLQDVSDSAGSGLAKYAIQLPVPAGYTQKPGDDWQNSGDVERRPQIEKTRKSCLVEEWNNIGAPPTDQCSKVLGGDKQAQWEFDAISNYGDNVFLTVKTRRNSLNVVLNGQIFPLTIGIANAEAKLVQEIDDKKAAQAGTVEAPSDL